MINKHIEQKVIMYNKLFSCSDGTCVSISVLCDFHVDCIDGEDEDCGKLSPLSPFCLLKLFQFKKIIHQIYVRPNIIFRCIGTRPGLHTILTKANKL